MGVLLRAGKALSSFSLSSWGQGGWAERRKKGEDEDEDVQTVVEDEGQYGARSQEVLESEGVDCGVLSGPFLLGGRRREGEVSERSARAELRWVGS